MLRVQESPAVLWPDVNADQVWSTAESLYGMDTVTYKSSEQCKNIAV